MICTTYDQDFTPDSLHEDFLFSAAQRKHSAMHQQLNEYLENEHRIILQMKYHWDNLHIYPQNQIHDATMIRNNRMTTASIHL